MATEQAYHYYASTAFNWAVAPTRKEAVAAVARMAGSDIIKVNVKNHGGLYVWSCRVELPQSAHYSIRDYAPEYLMDKEGDITDDTQRVPTSRHVESRVVNTKGLVALED